MSESVDPLLVGIVAIIGLAAGAQLIASRFRIPSVLFLVVAGLVIGPEGFGLVPRDVVTGTVTSVVGASIAIVIFQDGFALDLKSLENVRASTAKLVTVGAAVSLLGTALVVRFALDTAWGVALLIGALVIATGPTVLVPILNVVDAPERVAVTLRTEGLVNDITAAIVAVAMFEAVTLQETDLLAFVEALLTRLSIGVVVGVLVAGVVWYLITRVDFSPQNAVQNTRLLVFATAVLAYGGAELAASEAGIAAAATAGVVLGQTTLPYRAGIQEFEDDVSLLVLSFLFLVLTALLDFDTLRLVGLGGVVVVALVVLVIRPAAVFLSTWGGPFTLREQLFMSAVAPRGILTAGIATLFALRLRDTNPEASAYLLGTVFLVIIVTSAIEGGIARHLADALDVESTPVVVVGAGQYGRMLAHQYLKGGTRVELIDSDPRAVERGREEGLLVHAGDGTEVDRLRRAGADRADLIVGATDDDETNLRVARLGVEEFETAVAIRLNDRANRAQAHELGAQLLPVSLSASSADHPAAEDGWLLVPSAVGATRELELDEGMPADHTVADVEATLPRGCFVTAVRRNGRSHAARPEFELEPGDVLALVGRAEAVDGVRTPYTDA